MRVRTPWASRQGRYLCLQLAVLCVPVVLFTLFYPYPLAYPDPATFRRTVLEMFARGEVLVPWDPPVRYVLLFDLAVLTGGRFVGRLGVLQAGVYAYLLVPLGIYGLFATARSPAAGLAAVVTSTVGRIARVPPTALVWDGHWQVATGYPLGLAALALGIATIRARQAGDHRRELGYAALTGGTCGLTLGAEPWVALFATLGITCAWATHGAVRPLAVAGTLGTLAVVPVMFVPRWEDHLVRFVVEVIDPYGPLLSVDALFEGPTLFDIPGVLLLFGGMAYMSRRGTVVSGGWVTVFSILSGLFAWGLFTVTTLSGIGIRGLYWSLLLGVPAVVVQAAAYVPGDHLVARVYEQLFVRPERGPWIALLGIEILLFAFSLWVFRTTYAPPA